MSTRLGGAYVDVRAKTDKLGTDLDKAHSSIKSAAAKMENAFDRVTKGVFNIKTAIVGLAGSYALKQLAGGFIETGNAVQKMQISLDTITKGQGVAWFNKLNTWAAQMPVNTEKAIQSFTMMRAMGLKPTISDMTILVDTMSALGGSSDALEGIARALGQIQTKGKVSAEELMQLAERGVPAYEILAEKLNLTKKQLGSIGNAGIDASVAIKALLEGMGERFGGQSKKIMQTWEGMMQSLAQYWFDFKKDVMGAGVMEALESAMGRLVDAIRDLKSDTENYRSIIKSFGLAAVNAIAMVIDSVAFLIDSIASIRVGLNKAEGYFYSFAASAVEAYEKVGSAAAFSIMLWETKSITKAKQAVVVFFSDIGDKADEFRLKAENSFAAAAKAASDGKKWHNAADAVRKFSDSFKTEGIKTVNKEVEKFGKNTEEITKSAGDWADINDDMIEGLKDAADVVKDFAESSKEMNDIDMAIEDWFGDIDAANKKLSETNAELKEIAENAQKSKEIMKIDIALDDYFGEIDAFSEGMNQAGKEASEAHEKALKEAEDRQQKFADNVQDITADAFTNIWDGVGDGFGGLCDSIFDMFKQTLIQMAAKAASTQIIIPIAQQIMGGASSLLGGLLGGGGGGGMLSGITSLFGSGTGGGGILSGLMGSGSGGGGFSLTGSGSLLSRIPGVSSLTSGLSSLTSGVGNMLSGVGETVGNFLGMSGIETVGTQTISSGMFQGVQTSGFTSTGLGGLSGAMGAGSLGGLGYSLLGDSLGLPVGEYSGLTAGVGGTLGSMAGSAIAGGIGAGATAGSVVPVVGTIIGAILGGIAGSFLGGDGDKHVSLQSDAQMEYGAEDIDWGNYRGEDYTYDDYRKKYANKYYGQAFEALDTTLDKTAESIYGQVDTILAQMPEDIASDIENQLSGLNIQFDSGPGAGQWVIDSDHAEEDIQKIAETFYNQMWEQITPVLENGIVSSLSKQLSDVDLSMFSADSGIMQLLGSESIFDQSGGDYQKAEGVSLEAYAEAANQVFIYAEQVGAALSAVKDAFSGASEPMTSYAAAMEAVKQTVNQTVSELEALGVRDDELALLKKQGTEGLTAQVNEEFAGKRLDVWEQIAESVQKATGIWDEQQAVLDTINDKYDQWRDTMIDLGAVEEGLAIIEQHRATELEAATKAVENATEAEIERTQTLEEQYADTTNFVIGQIEMMQNAITSVDEFLGSMNFSDLAPTESAAMYQGEYEKLLAAAGSGEQEDLSNLFSFVQSEFLPYMQAYQDGGTDYNDSYSDVMDDVAALRNDFTNFKVDPNAQNEEDSTEKLRKTIEDILIPALKEGGNISIKVQLDGHDIGVAVAEQQLINPDLGGA